MEHYLKQNNAIDIYKNYFSGSSSTKVVEEPPSAKTLTILRSALQIINLITFCAKIATYIHTPVWHYNHRDPNELKRAVTNISWYPDGAHRLAAAYSMLEFQKSPTGMPLESYIWEIGNSMNSLTLSRISCYDGFLKLIYDYLRMYMYIW